MTAQQQVVPTSPDPSALIESVIVKGDLSGLNGNERIQYYRRVCESIGLNPLTKPFEYLTLNNKLVLYARRDATDQLRKVHNVSVTDMTEAERDGVFVVTVKVQNATGRTDMAKGAVTINGLKGDALANALMKAETKAKRRATLSICGLGFLDETEIETIPNAQPANGLGPPDFIRKQRTMAEISANKKRREDECAGVQKDLSQIETLSELERYEKEHLTPQFMGSLGNAQWAVEEWLETRRTELSEPAEEAVDEDGVISTKADYVRNCLNIIAEASGQALLLKWWNGQKKHRIALGFTVEENADLMDRVKRRAEELKANGEAVMEAGG